MGNRNECAPACVSRAPSVDTLRSSLTVVEEVYLMSCFCLSQAKVVPEDSVDSRVGGSRAAVTLSEAPGQLKTIKVQKRKLFNCLAILKNPSVDRSGKNPTTTLYLLT